MFHMAKLKKQHMTIHWKAIVQDDSSIPATEATLKEKATLVGRVGLMMLSVGTGAWHYLHRRHWTACHLLHLH